MTARVVGSVEREALAAGVGAAGLAAVLIATGPPGIDLAAHVYQRALFLHHGFVLWNNFWYAGRYSFVTYSVLYYPVAALVGTTVLAVASIGAAAFAFALVVGREWGPVARLSSRAFAVVWATTVFSAAFPFALGAALALLALAALQARRTRRFALLAFLSCAASPLAFVLLVVLLAGVALGRRPERARVIVPAAVVGAAAAGQLALARLFPDHGRFPFRPLELVPALIFCALGIFLTLHVPRARPLLGVFVVYVVACVAAFAVPSAVGSNIERLRYAALPLALLTLSLRAWRPLRYAVPALVLAAIWNVTPLATSFAGAAGDAASARGYWAPAVSFLRANLAPSFRVEAVDTVGHWPALRLPAAGIPIVRGWYRQNDFPENELLYDRFGARAYRAWLESLGVRYVVLSDAPPDYSSRGEAALLRSGRSGLVPVLRARHVTVYELPHARPIVPGATVIWLWPTRVVFAAPHPGRYRVVVRWSPYLRTFQGCVVRGRDGTVRVDVPRPGLVDLDFDLNVHRGVEVLTGTEPRRVCAA